MKTVRCYLPRELACAEIHTLADVHLGDEHCDLNLVRERIGLIASKVNAYCILNGDLINNSTKTSIGDIYAEQYMPMEQVKRCVELLEPVKDKILCITNGNHENRSYKKEGIDLTEILAMQLGLADRYSKGGCLLFVRVGESSKGESRRGGQKRQICYTVYCLHGSGGGRKEGAKAIRLADMASIVDADVYIHSHTHMPMVLKQGYFRTDVPNSKAHNVTKLFVNTAAYLDYGGYGEAQEYKPSNKDTPVVYLNGRKKEASARL